MINRTEKILELLKEAKKLTAEQHKEAATSNDDVQHIDYAIEIAEQRLAYLKAQPKPTSKSKKTGADKSSEAKPDEKAEGKPSERDEYKKMFRDEYADATVEQLEKLKTEAESAALSKPEDDDAKCVMEVLNELIAAKKTIQP